MIATDPRVGRWSPFFEVIGGKCSLNSLPSEVIQPGVIAQEMLKMRDFAQERDKEQVTGVYHGVDGHRWMMPKEAVDGWYNGVDKAYESGLVPVVAGGNLVTEIHSHPPMRRWVKERRTSEDDWHLAGAIPSVDDLANVVYPIGAYSHRVGLSSGIVVGRDLAVMVCKTKQTTSRNSLENGRANVWVNVSRLIWANFREAERRISQETEFNKRLLGTVKSCREFGLGLYLMRLRATRFPQTYRWIRFSPQPDDIPKAVDLLVGQEADDK